MEAFMAWLKSVNDVVWGPGMLVLLVGTYVAYVFIAYHRIGDQELTAQGVTNKFLNASV